MQEAVAQVLVSDGPENSRALTAASVKQSHRKDLKKGRR
jgi:hypothetical protein